MAAGKFITFEGGEGAGKSTQVRLLSEDLARIGISVCTTREPGGTPGGEQIRDLLVQGPADRWDAVTEALLHFAARRDHVRRFIEPRLAAGTWVISDRFADSTMAYQGYGHGMGRTAIERLYAATVGNFHPDLTLILDLPVDAGLRRAAQRPHSESRYESLGRDFHERLRLGFREIAEREPERCLLLDASGEIEDVRGRVRAAVAARLGLAL